MLIIYLLRKKDALFFFYKSILVIYSYFVHQLFTITVVQSIIRQKKRKNSLHKQILTFSAFLVLPLYFWNNDKKSYILVALFRTVVSERRNLVALFGRE
jgi:hypothetical protein